MRPITGRPFALIHRMIQQRCLRSGSTRPALMQGVGRRVESGGQKRIKVSILHQKADVITAAITAISKDCVQSALTRLQALSSCFTAATGWPQACFSKCSISGVQELQALPRRW